MAEATKVSRVAGVQPPAVQATPPPVVDKKPASVATATLQPPVLPVAKPQPSVAASAVEVVKPSVAVNVAAPKPSTQPKPEATGDSVKERILALMVEKTGYPQDMLDVDLDLEADLGVDTVKQAEMFAAIREIYNIPRDENRKLRDYPTSGARQAGGDVRSNS